VAKNSRRDTGWGSLKSLVSLVFDMVSSSGTVNPVDITQDGQPAHVYTERGFNQWIFYELQAKLPSDGQNRDSTAVRVPLLTKKNAGGTKLNQ
jgi:hypothetical protein